MREFDPPPGTEQSEHSEEGPLDATSTGPSLALPSPVRFNQLPSPASVLDDPGAKAGRVESVQGALRLAAALLGYGLPVFRVEEALARLTGAMGVRVSSLGLPKALVVSVEGLANSRAVFVPAESGVVDLDRLSSLHGVVAEVESGRLAPRDVDAAVHRILDAPPHYAAPFVVLASALSAWGAAVILGGGAAEAHTSFGLGLLVGLLLLLASRWSALSLVLPVVAGTLVGGLSASFDSALQVNGAVVLSAALLPLLPGLTMTVAMMELGAGHSVCGTSRLVGALTGLLQLGFGALVGAKIGGHLQVPTQLPLRDSQSVWLLAAGVLALTLGVAVLVHVRRRDLGWVLAISVVAFVVSRISSAPFGPEVGALVSSCTVGLLSNAFARRFDRPASVLQVPGILMLVPGCLGLLSLSGLLGQRPLGAVASSGQVLMVATALSLGVLLSTSMLPARRSL